MGMAHVIFYLICHISSSIWRFSCNLLELCLYMTVSLCPSNIMTVIIFSTLCKCVIALFIHFLLALIMVYSILLTDNLLHLLQRRAHRLLSSAQWPYLPAVKFQQSRTSAVGGDPKSLRKYCIQLLVVRGVLTSYHAHLLKSSPQTPLRTRRQRDAVQSVYCLRCHYCGGDLIASNSRPFPGIHALSHKSPS